MQRLALAGLLVLSALLMTAVLAQSGAPGGRGSEGIGSDSVRREGATGPGTGSVGEPGGATVSENGRRIVGGGMENGGGSRSMTPGSDSLGGGGGGPNGGADSNPD